MSDWSGNGNGNGNDLNGNGRDWESKRHSHTPLVSTVRDSEKSSITMNRKSTTGFTTSYRWTAYVTLKSPKGWLKKRFFCF